MDLPAPAVLDRLADAGWPPLERESLYGWTLRAANGVTRRANSVLTAGPVPDIPEAVVDAERWYADRRLPAVFQVSPATSPELPRVLAERGYREHSVTAVLVADRRAVETAGAAPSAGESARPLGVASSPSPGWLDTWWAVDGRGGSAERATVKRILAGGPALYAWAGVPGGPDAPDAVARLALVGGWGGLYAVATLPHARRRGRARALAVALARAGEARGVERLWLQVLAQNAGAVALYEGLGFVRASAYAYWERPAESARPIAHSARVRR